VFDEIEKANYKGILNFVTAYYIDIKPDLKEGAKFNDRALAIYIDSKKAPYSLEGFSQTTRVYQIKLALMQKAYQKAMVWINEAEKASGYHADRVLYQLKVQCLLGLGKLQEAIDAVDQLLAVISAENSSFSFATSSAQDFTPGYIISDANGLVRLAEAFRNYHGKPSVEEEKLYWLALTQLQHNIGNTPLNQELKKTFDKISSGLMKAALNRNFSREENNKLLTFMEILSSQDLINNFLLKREIAGNTGLYRLVEEEQFIRAYITFLKKELQKRDSEDTRQQLFEKEIELKKIREQLAAQYRQSNLFVVPQVDINTGNKKNIIKFNVTGNKLFKQRLHQGKLTYHKIDDYPTLKRDIEDYLRAINNLQTPVSTIKKKGTVLYNKLFTNDFETIRPTVIIADDILHYLPFELLVKDNAYLLENHTISYASSFYFLNSKGKEGNVSRNKKAVFFAPEYSGTVQENQLALRDAAYTLSGAKEEVKQLSKLIAGRKYIGNQASKRNFKSLDPDISILHLAMHSNLNDGDPELSNLMFSNTEEDYEMYISELYGMNFNADLAVLSACNTGIGGFKDGGNLVSIHQAFTIAGIPATIASLWHAPDHSTKEIMLSFYKNLQQGQDKAVALRQAKLDYLQQTTDENLQHPLYWAGFVLSGDDTPVELPTSSLWRQSRSIGGILLSILLITIVILVSKRRNRRNIA
jgi:CHAT domain-containing protein